PGGAALSPALRYLCRVNAAPTGKTKHKTKKKSTAGIFKKKLSVGHFWAFVVCCFFKKGDLY
ncbi:hypothetical protein ACVGW8_08365, partial [Enterobacter hormaechei]